MFSMLRQGFIGTLFSKPANKDSVHEQTAILFPGFSTTGIIIKHTNNNNNNNKISLLKGGARYLLYQLGTTINKKEKKKVQSDLKGKS